MEVGQTARCARAFGRRAFLALSAMALGGVLALSGCSQQVVSENESSSDATAQAETQQVQQTEVRIGALKGPTGMGLAGMMGEAPSGVSDSCAYTFELAGSADELTPMLIQGDLDMCMVPANLAAVLYQKTEGAVQVLAVNTLGVLDIVCADDSVQSIQDLAGKTIVSAGKGSTPEYALRYLLENNGIDPDTDVTIEWKSEHAECLAALEADPSVVAMLPQPFATSAPSKVEGARIAIDLNDVWDETAQAVGSDAQLITGVVVARTQFVQDNPDAVAAFMDDYANSITFVNDNVDEASQIIGDQGIIDAAVAQKAIPYCNIVFVSGEEMKSSLSGYLQTLYEAAPESVGGAMPGEVFYYLS